MLALAMACTVPSPEPQRPGDPAPGTSSIDQAVAPAPGAAAVGGSSPTGPLGIGLPPVVSRCPAEDDACVDLATLDYTWTTAEGWTISTLELAGDLDADGLVDAVVGLSHADGEHTSIIRGPLDRQLVLPDDEDVGIAGYAPHVGDLDADGHADLIARDPAYDFTAPVPDRVILGPLVGQIEPTTDARAVTLAAPAGSYTDWDGDGVVDLVVDQPGDGESAVLKAWTGVWSTWGVGEPTVALTWSCAADPDDVDVDYARTADMDGNGVDEVWLVALGLETCDVFGIPADATGVIDVPTTPLVLPSQVGGTPMGDLDGDGTPDWALGSLTDADYRQGPLEFSAGSTSGEPVALNIQSTFYPVVSPLEFDADGDGIADLVVGPQVTDLIEWQNRTVSEGWLVTGGLTGGLSTGDVMMTVLLDPGDVPVYFVQSGRGMSLVKHRDERNQTVAAWIVELAPTATALPIRR